MIDEIVEPCRKEVNGFLQSLVNIIKDDENIVCRIKAVNEVKRRLDAGEITKDKAIKALFKGYVGNDNHHIKEMIRDILGEHPETTYQILYVICENPRKEQSIKDAADEILGRFLLDGIIDSPI